MALLKIHGVIDIQGFYVGGKFIPRQLAIITRDTITKVYEFETGINPSKLTLDERKTVEYVQRHVNHLDLEPSPFSKLVYPSDDYDVALHRIELDYQITEDTLLAVNNNHAEELLTLVCFPFVSIRTIITGLPNKEKLMEFYTKGTVAFSTAGKVEALWKFIERLQSEVRAMNQEAVTLQFPLGRSALNMKHVFPTLIE